MESDGHDTDRDGLRTLLAERDIERALLRYCRGVDRMDAGLVRSAFHPDARVCMGEFTGSVDELVAVIWKLVGRRTMTMHYLTNTLVEFDPADPARARSESYGFALQPSTAEPPKGNLINGFRYLDTFTLTRGQWRIAERVTVSEWLRVDDPAGQWPLPAGATTGSRDGTDLAVQPWGPSTR
ncbi:nuclear transport factor 2 family protein [Nakamurella lactea]|uniref:nuclear transport factor 2 family protein n=1 Tax=Nakamurella lactea TaxID=459515 RepID=UPI00040D9CAD|nr:nuclear transport factor 2 family protein [Nakamurella lactea]